MGSAKDKVDSYGREKIKCHICGKYYHRIDVHLKTSHKETTIEEYLGANQGASLLSEYGKIKAAKAMKNVVAAQKPKKKKKKSAHTHVLGQAEMTPRDLSKMSELDKAYIPEHDPNWVIDQSVLTFWEDLAHGISDNEPIYIGGPTGCGKSKGVAALAAALNQPMSRIQLNRDFRVSEFIGQRTLEENKNGKSVTGWKDGVLTEAMRNGWWILLDEIDQAYSDVLMKMQGVLEGANLVLTENFGEVVVPNEYFRIIATANTFGRGDDSGLYTGAKVMNEAMMDRFGTVIEAKYPGKETEINILVKSSGIAASTAKKMVSCAHSIREAHAKEECSCTFSTRRLILWARKSTRYKSVNRSLGVSVLNRLEYDDRTFVSSIVRRYFADDEKTTVEDIGF